MTRKRRTRSVLDVVWHGPRLSWTHCVAIVVVLAAAAVGIGRILLEYFRS